MRLTEIADTIMLFNCDELEFDSSEFQSDFQALVSTTRTAEKPQRSAPEVRTHLAS